MLLLCWRGSFFYSLRGLQLLYPFAALSMPAAAQWPALGADYAVGNMPFLYGHIGVIVRPVRYCRVACAVGFAAEPPPAQSPHFAANVVLPPLLGLEKLMFQSMLAGFVLLSISVGGKFGLQVLLHQV